MKLNLKSCFLILIFFQGLLYLGQTGSGCISGEVIVSGQARCSKCGYNYYLDYFSCIACPEGKVSTSGSKSSFDCYACTDPVNCLFCEKNSKSICTRCKKNYYQQNGQCIACPQGEISREGSIGVDSCGPCYEGCSSCTVPRNPYYCQSCEENYYFWTDSMGLTECGYCGDGFFSPKGSKGAKSCKACTTGCKTCSDTGAGKCLVCKENYYMVNNDCVACPSGKKAPEGSTSSAACLACVIDGCQLCSEDNICGTCKAGTYMKDNKCISCAAGKSSFKGSTSADACKICHDAPECLSCSEPGYGKCTSCRNGYYVTDSGLCGACSSKNFDQCTKCTADNTCAVCEIPTFLRDGSCERCVPGNYPTSTTTKIKDCKKCEDANCRYCIGPGTGKCVECDFEFILEKGKCKDCGPGKFFTGSSPYTWDDCADCPEGCSSCGGYGGSSCFSCFQGPYFDEDTLNCLQCPVGQSAPKGATSASECFKCSDNNCERCSTTGTGKCTSCAEDFYLSDSKCVACPDGGFSPPGSTSKDACGACYYENCDYCTNWSIYGCQECKVGYYGVGSKCNPCGEGKSSLVGSTSASQCFDCADFNCVSCLAKGKGQCSECKEDYYLADDQTCKVCDIENCKGCKSNGQCASCKSGYYFADDNTCKACEDENCKACDGANIGRCTSCESGFKLISGTCKASGESPKTNNLVSATIRYDMTMAKFNEEGGKNYFIAKTSRVLGVDIEQVTVSSVRKGSVIVDYEVALSGDDTAAKNMKKAMDAAVPGGHMDFYTDGKVLNYDSQVGSRDSDDGGSSSKIGIIIGVVAGVVCVVIAIVIWKKIAIMKAKKVSSMSVNNKNKVIAVDDSADKTFKIEQVSA